LKNAPYGKGKQESTKNNTQGYVMF